MTNPVLLAHAHYKELKSSRYTLAVLPWGATEPHNLHLPYGTDIIETDRISAEAGRIAAGRGARIIVLPTIPYGVNTGQLDLPLTINMNPSTQRAVIQDIIDSLSHHGIEKLLILNGHGGNDFKHIIRELQPHTAIFLCTANWWQALDARTFFDIPGDHAGEMETSLMMHLSPDTVLPLGEAGKGEERKLRIRGFQEGWAWAPRQWSKVTADTGTGDPKASTPQKGEMFFRAVTEKIGNFLVDLDAADLAHLYEGDEP